MEVYNRNESIVKSLYRIDGPNWVEDLGNPGYNTNGGLPTSTQLGKVPIFQNYTQTRVLNGYKNPSFRRQIRHHQEATTPMTAEYLTLDAEPGSVLLQFTGKGLSVGPYYNKTFRQTTGYSGHFLMTVNPFPASPVNLDASLAKAKAKETFVQNAIAADRKFQAGVALGELRETLRMLRNPLKAIRDRTNDYYQTLRKGRRLSSRADRKKWLSRSYLEYAYGIRPLMSDVKSAHDALVEHRVRFAYEYKRIRGTGFDESWAPEDSVGPSRTINPAGTVSSTLRTRSRVLYSYYGEMRRKVQAERYARSSIWGFDPVRDFLPTAWELIPYSFLVDYFTNIQEVIDGWSFHSVDLLWASSVVVRENTRELVGVNWNNPAAWLSWNSGIAAYRNSRKLLVADLKPPKWRASYKSVSRSWKRKEFESFVPSFRLEIPTSSGKYLNMAALARQFVKLGRYY